MTVQELIDKLQAIEDKEKKVFVWEGLSAQYMITDFGVEEIDGVIELD